MNSLALTIDALFLNHRDALIRTIFGIVGCPQTAEDLAHEAYLKMQQAVSSQTVDHPRPFLYQIARNLALDHLRKERIRQTVEPLTRDGSDDDAGLLDRIPSNTPTPEQQAADQQQLGLLLTALDSLTERRRQILVLHKFHHWTYERIAEHFGISRSAVEKNVHAALAHLLAGQEGHPRN